MRLQIATTTIVLIILCLSATATAQTQETDDRRFWDAWNVYYRVSGARIICTGSLAANQP